MNKPDESVRWKKIPNDLFASKVAFCGTPRPTKAVMDKVQIEDIEEIDSFFKERKKLPNNKRNKKGTSIMPKALSEIFFNKDQVGIYCFDGIILPDEEYANLDNLEKADYTIMLLTEMIKQNVCSILTSPEMNEVSEMKEINLRIEKRINKRDEAKAKKRNQDS